MKKVITNSFISYIIQNNKEMKTKVNNENELIIQLCYLLCNYNIYFNADSSDVLLYFIEDDNFDDVNEKWEKEMIINLYNEVKEKYKEYGMNVDYNGYSLSVKNVTA